MPDHRKFEDDEIERFLAENYGYKNTRLIITNLLKKDYPDVKEKTKEGIRQGVDGFISEHGAETIYLSDLAKFAFSNLTEQRINEGLTNLGLTLENTGVYSKDVCETYRMFVYNESLARFKKKFQKEI